MRWKFTPLQIVLYYALFGLIWVAFSDRVLSWLVLDHRLEELISTLNGWIFVFLTAGLLYILIKSMYADIIQFQKLSQDREKALEESEQLYRSLVNASPDAVTLSDMSGNITTVSSKLLQLYDLQSSETLVGTNVINWIAPEDRELALANIRNVLQGKPSQSNLYKLLRKDGSFFTGEIYSSVFLGRDGKPAGMVSVTRDVTEKIQNEASLRESENKFHSLYTNMLEGVALHEIIYGPAGVPEDYLIVDINRRYEEILGLKKENVIGKRASLLYGVAKAPYLIEYSTVADTGEPYTFESYFEPMDRYFSISVSPWGKKGFATIFADISIRKKYENTLRESNEDLEKRVLERTGALSERERFLTAVFENIPNMIFVKDARTLRYVRFNKAGEEMLGLSREEMLGKTDYELFPQGIAMGFTANDRLVLATNSPSDVPEEKVISQNGKERVLHTRKIPISGENGLTEYLLGISEDITERKRVENALKTSEERYRRILQTASDGFLLADINGNIFQVNQAYCAMSGYSEKELLGMRISDLEAIETSEETEKHLRKVFENGEDRYESRHNRKDGVIYDVEISSRFYEQDNGWIVVFARDITERKKHEIYLKQLSEAVAQSPNTVVITNLEGGIEYVNPKFVELTGYSVKEVLGQNPKILNSGSQPKEFYKDMWETIKSGRIWQGEFLNKKKNGEYYWERASISPVIENDGRIRHFVAVKEDISKQKQAEEELRLAKEAAESANRSKSAFLANMSHEIRTPMNAMLGFAQLMIRDQGLSEKNREYVRSINRSGEHLLTLINDILELSKIEAGRMVLNPTACDFHDMINDLELMFRMRTEVKKLRFVSRIDGAVPGSMIIDEAKTRQVLINLLGNAVKFTHSGTIELRAFADDVTDEITKIRIEVEDTGPGISGEDLGLIFQAFEQSVVGRKTGGGTGLGLSISRQYAQLMGGDIMVRSTPGKGSVFTFTFIAHNSAVPVLPRIRSAERIIGLTPGQKSWKILVADDRDENRTFLVEMLKGVGFHVMEAVDGLQAVDLYRREAPDLIFMDLNMPNMNGYEAGRSIRNTPTGKELPIIAVTAYAFEEERLKSETEGMNAFIRKPFKEIEIFKTIQSLLPVTYIVSESNEPYGPVQSDEALEIGDLISLTDEDVETLVSATLSADYDRLLQLINGLKKDNFKLASRMESLVKRFQYTELLEFLKFRRDESGRRD